MKPKKHCLPYLILDGEQYIFVGDFSDPIRKGFLDGKEYVEKEYFQLILPIESILDENYFINKNGEIEECNPYCKHCSCEKIIRKDFNWRIIYLEVGVPVKVKIKRYKCKRCKKKFQTEFQKYYGKYCNYSNKTRNQIIKLIQYDWISLRNIKNILKELLCFEISHESVRKYLKQTNSLYWHDKELEPSGYFAYDAQWVRINHKWKYRLTIFDTIKNMPVACCIADDESNQTVEDFINKSIPLKYRKAIVTDSKQEYEEIMTKLGFTHQQCTFHLNKNIQEAMQRTINKKINKFKRKQKQKNNPKTPKYKIKKIAKTKKEELEKEMREHIQIFYEIFHQETFKKAIEYINYLKKELKKFPKELAEYLNKNFFPIYRKYLKFLEKEHKGKLECTNNKLENYFGNTLNKHTKRIYRTKKGLFNHILARKNGWIENQEKT